MEMEVISRESIKPCSPTPTHLRNYPLSLFDNAVSPNSVPLIYFYAPQESPDEASKLSLLKKSLSQALCKYYPFAGRFKDPTSVHCNDEGVSLVVTRIKTKNLSNILRNPTDALLSPLFPDELQWKDMGLDSSLLAVQINCFACGGMAITVCMCHKVGDASTLFNFFNDWSTLTQQPHITVALPHLGASLFPQTHFPLPRQYSFVPHHNMVCRRLVFEGSKIDSLKALVSSSSSSQKVENPTRFEVVVALIYKCAVSALGLSVSNTLLRVAINFRKRMIPPLPDKSLGNLVSSFYASSMDNDEAELHELVTKTREGLALFCDKYVRNFGDLKFVSEFLRFGQAVTTDNKSSCEDGEKKKKKKKDMIFFSGWCRFSAYEADFGWGRPVWVTTVLCPVKNSVVLMDTRDGKGIEAVVCMLDKDMAMFERHVHLLRYASLEPNRWTCSSCS
ncbi:stemmadenine O-acetyltransferase-like [Arachis duranensis]|uniref:Stemmadenine O-acetyltransferase-like n=1 Tax=Arachis duranensis TaxID=130453 RepID=A0A6P4CV88_ARADU|nr:stemmadenine O-acetyltransferase-like [Arachis duranensis]